MPPRHAYWTILVDDQPTAFRAHDPEDLLPTLNRLKEKHSSAVMKWFERGRLWESRDAAREAGLGRGERRWEGPRPERDDRAARDDRPPADGDRPRPPRADGDQPRDRNWRPGGEHRDPRQKFKDAKKAKWNRFKKKVRSRWEDKPAAPSHDPRDERRGRPPSGRPRSERPRESDRSAWPPREPRDSDWRDRPRDRARSEWSDRPPRDRDSAKEFGGEKSYGTRPSGTKPGGRGSTPFGKRKPWGSTPADRNAGDRSRWQPKSGSGPPAFGKAFEGKPRKSFGGKPPTSFGSRGPTKPGGYRGPGRPRGPKKPRGGDE